MYKFRKNPVVIEAFQMTAKRRWDNSEWPNWLHEAWQIGLLCCEKTDPEPLHINTLEGPLHITFDDYIIQGVQGEIYPCKPDIFEATYTPEPDNCTSAPAEIS